jgi:hypothetical protein
MVLSSRGRDDEREDIRFGLDGQAGGKVKIPPVSRIY